MKWSNKKQKKLKKKYLLFCFFAIIFIILLLLIYFSISKIFMNYSKKFEIQSRVENVSSAIKSDPEYKKTVGWLRVQGTNIDLPIIYAPKYDFSYEVSDFAWTETDYEELNNLVFITGHNIKNQSKNPYIADKDHNRFEHLMSFTYYDFVKDNQYFQYTFDGVDYVYKIYSVAYVDASNMNVYNSSKLTDEEMKKYIDQSSKSSIFDFDVDVNKDDKIISLVTCTKMFENLDNINFVVSGRLLRDNEKIELYNVNRNSNYDDIDKIMKGGDSDEEV